jgi:hypothetical protein
LPEPRCKGPVIVEVLAAYTGALFQGAIIVAEPDRVRVRLANPSPD